MADIDIIFRGSENSGTEENQLQVFYNTNNKITVSIYDENVNNYGYPTIISLNKQTAIRFHRELKKQISYIESEVSNG
mgnify:CR=1 FL=1|jgi:hypothetical protein